MNGEKREAENKKKVMTSRTCDFPAVPELGRIRFSSCQTRLFLAQTFFYFLLSLMILL